MVPLAILRPPLVRACLGIGLMTWVIHGLFHVPALYADDWGQGLEEILAGRAAWFDSTRMRPLLFLPFVLQHSIFGLNYDAHYVVLAGFYVAMALLLYAIVRRSVTGMSHDVALVTALLFVAFPTNFAHTWLTMAHHYSGAVLGLAYAWALLVHASSGRQRHLVTAATCLLLSIGFYEGHLGMAMLWPAILVVLHRERATWRRVVRWFAPAVIVGALAAYRILSYESPWDYYSADLITLSPGTLLSRLILGYEITLAWGWTETVRHYVPAVSSTGAALAVLAGAVGAAAGLACGRLARIRRFENAGADTRRPWQRERGSGMRLGLAGAAIGLGLIGAGYLPIVTAFMPILSGFSSRLNLFATIGGAWLLACCLAAGARLLAVEGRERRVLWAAAAPLLALGAVAQVSAQYRVSVAWAEQRILWQTLFESAPNFADETAVLFVFPGLAERNGYWSWWRMPLEGSWDASAGVRLLYANPTLSADIVFPDVQRFREPVLGPAGVRNWLTGRIAPWHRVVAFSYDPRSTRLRQLDALPASLGVGEGGRLCETCVLPGPIPETALRGLVSDAPVSFPEPPQAAP